MTSDPLAGVVRVPGQIVVVTGTDTDAGKTHVTAALVVAAQRAGLSRIAVYKPQQTGVEPGEAGDVHVVREIAARHGVDGHALTVREGQRLREPMAPPQAAAIEGIALRSLAEHAAAVAELAATHDAVFVEGSGGLLVDLDGTGGTIADLALALQKRHAGRVSTVVACRPDLGTLNHTALTLEAMWRRGVVVRGTVLGSWPDTPTVLHTTNREYIAAITDPTGHRVPLLGAVPRGW